MPFIDQNSGASVDLNSNSNGNTNANADASANANENANTKSNNTNPNIRVDQPFKIDLENYNYNYNYNYNLLSTTEFSSSASETCSQKSSLSINPTPAATDYSNSNRSSLGNLFDTNNINISDNNDDNMIECIISNVLNNSSNESNSSSNSVNNDSINTNPNSTFTCWNPLYNINSENSSPIQNFANLTLSNNNNNTQFLNNNDNNNNNNSRNNNFTLSDPFLPIDLLSGEGTRSNFMNLNSISGINNQNIDPNLMMQLPISEDNMRSPVAHQFEQQNNFFWNDNNNNIHNNANINRSKSSILSFIVDNKEKKNINANSINANLFKTEICARFQKTGYCPYNEKCQFAHGVLELKSSNKPSNWKTKICRNWLKTGNCRYGKRCCYKHGETDDGSNINDQSPPPEVLKNKD